MKDKEYKAITQERLNAISFEQWGKWAEKYGAILKVTNLKVTKSCILIQHVIYDDVTLAELFFPGTDKELVYVTLVYDDFVDLLAMKYKDPYSRTHEYIKNAEKIHELINELEAM